LAWRLPRSSDGYQPGLLGPDQGRRHRPFEWAGAGAPGVVVLAAVGEALDELRGHLDLPPAQELADVDVVPRVGGKGGVYRVGMASAMVRALAKNDSHLAETWIPRLGSDDPDRYLTAAMFMTEKAGGSDVGANECVATQGEDGQWRISGEKWFCSNPTADLVLILARPEGRGPGTGGLGLFLMPRNLDAQGNLPAGPDDLSEVRNHYIIHRLKSKFGNKALASAEIGLRGALAWPVGDIDRGMKQMLDMVNATRVGIVTAAAGSMRRAVFESLEHASGRQTFGRRLDHHPLMRDTLVELVVDATTTLSAAIEMAQLMEKADGGAPQSERLLRMLTPILKGYAAERARVVATEAMEVRGGNGYIEGWPNGRLLRDVYVHAIWEGSGNIMALDVLRALGKGHGPAYFEAVERLSESMATGKGGAAELARALLASTPALQQDVASLAALDLDGAQLRVRRIERRMAITYIATLLAHSGVRGPDRQRPADIPCRPFRGAAGWPDGGGRRRRRPAIVGRLRGHQQGRPGVARDRRPRGGAGGSIPGGGSPRHTVKAGSAKLRAGWIS
jgi:alkylation response protein AidB-like acyl-CoA dehydrogenase